MAFKRLSASAEIIIDKLSSLTALMSLSYVRGMTIFLHLSVAFMRKIHKWKSSFFVALMPVSLSTNLFSIFQTFESTEVGTSAIPNLAMLACHRSPLPWLMGLQPGWTAVGAENSVYIPFLFHQFPPPSLFHKADVGLNNYSIVLVFRLTKSTYFSIHFGTYSNHQDENFGAFSILCLLTAIILYLSYM